MRILCKLTIALFITGSFILAQDREVQKETVAGHTMYSVLNKGDIPAIYIPEFYFAENAKEFYFANEPLMIVTNDGISHAYSIWHLDRHEIVNDRIGDLHFAATW